MSHQLPIVEDVYHTERRYVPRLPGPPRPLPIHSLHLARILAPGLPNKHRYSRCKQSPVSVDP